MTVAEWYDGRCLLVTGGTGFMGKVLLEKLLRSCTGIDKIYMLVRQKRGNVASRRIHQMVQLPLFDRLRNENPASFEKLIPIEGDITKEDLGLSEEDRRVVVENVSVVFHGAASLRLEAGLKDAVVNNALPTERILKLAKEMNKLEAFIHMSTAFCHCEEEVLYEKYYPTKDDPRDVIRTVQFLDEESVNLITPKLLGVHPNSYTYSKRLAETLVQEHGKDIHAAIVRPSIVLPTLHEPLPGWVDTLNGPVGLLIGSAKGVIRTMLCGADFDAEMIPVDIAINCIIAIAWKVGTEKPDGIPVFNVSQNAYVKITWGEILELGRKFIDDYPFEGAAWYPDGNIRTNRMVHNVLIVLLHILPAYFIDFLLTLFRQKRFMVRIQKRISTGLEVLQYFTMRQWNFRNEVAASVEDNMTEKDKEIFYITNTKYDINKYMLDCILGARQYCMKEPLSSLPKARRHMKMLYVLDRITAAFLYCLFGWFLYKTFFGLSTVLQKYH